MVEATATEPPACSVVVPFSSARKWSGVTTAEGTTWLLGAPEVLTEDQTVADAAEAPRRRGAAGRLLARSSTTLGEDALPEDIEPAALVVLADKIRADAAETLAYFAAQGVTLKVISGDNPVTVAAVAREAGLPDADRPSTPGTSRPTRPACARSWRPTACSAGSSPTRSARWCGPCRPRATSWP